MSKNLDENTVEMTVGRATSVGNLAYSISKTIQEGKKVRLVGIGANAVNQMVKGVAKSATFLAPVGKYVNWRVYFMDRKVDDERPAVDEGQMAVAPGVWKETLSAIVLESHLI